MIGSLWFGALGASTGSYELISTTVLGSSTATVTFSSLPAQYKHLQIRATSRTDVASVYVDTRLKINGDTTAANYSTHELYGSGSAVGSGGSGSFYPPGICYSTGSSATANNFGGIIIDILDFASTSKKKTFRGLSGASSSNIVALRSTGWYSTSAITSIELNTSGNFVTGSRFSLYGIRG